MFLWKFYFHSYNSQVLYTDDWNIVTREEFQTLGIYLIIGI